MKRFALSSLFLALLSVAACAQSTTYTITGGPYLNKYDPPYFKVFGMQLSGIGNEIRWVQAVPPQTGYTCNTMNNVIENCVASTGYTESGSVTVDGCSGPAKAVETFADNSVLTVYFTYDDDGGKWHDLCEGWVVKGTYVTTP